MATRRTSTCRVLDLTKHHSNGGTRTVVDKMNATVPGLANGSAAFFTELRSNLLLPPQNSTITMTTPVIYASDSAPGILALEAPSSFQLLASPTEVSLLSSLDTIPLIKTGITTSTSGRVDALILIADSIAQQCQISSYGLITHPLILSIYTLLVIILTPYLYKSNSDLGIFLIAVAGVSMACLIAIRWACSGYITAAEEINTSYLKSQEDGGEEFLITSTSGTETIGACVLHLQPRNFKASPPSSPKMSRRSHHSHHQRGGKALIRAWTTSSQYRKRGIGRGLLEEAVRITRERLGRDAEIGFSVSHANSNRVLPQMFNGGIAKGEHQAAKMLEEIVARDSGGRRRR